MCGKCKNCSGSEGVNGPERNTSLPIFTHGQHGNYTFRPIKTNNLFSHVHKPLKDYMLQDSDMLIIHAKHNILKEKKKNCTDAQNTCIKLFTFS